MPRSYKHCLLVVDDEPDLVQSVKDLLRWTIVCSVRRGPRGLHIMEQEKVHIVMTDQRMPEMTGVDSSAPREYFPDTVRLLFTAYADLNAVTDAINQGNVYRYITKPWEPDELRRSCVRRSSTTTWTRKPSGSCARSRKRTRNSKKQMPSCAGPTS